MQDNLQQNVDFILENIKVKINGNSDNDLAKFFKVKTGTISAWMVRNSMNYDLLIMRCKEYNYDLNEIIFGNTTNNSLHLHDSSRRSTGDPTSEVLIRLIREKDDRIIELSEEIGVLKNENKSLRIKAGYFGNSAAAEPNLNEM